MPNQDTIHEQRIQAIIESRLPLNEHVIEFRDDKSSNTRRQSWKIDLDDLFLRKNNGRIKAEMLTYEKTIGPIDENSEEGQEDLRQMIYNKDVVKFDELTALITAYGQEVPAVCLADGTLINGNRRAAVLKKLYSETNDAKFKTMECVVLPTGNPDDGYGHGAAPTENEIADLEYAYQMRRTGFSEYTGLNKAFMYKRGLDKGRTLEQMVEKNPVLNYEGITKRKFDNAVKKEKTDYLDTLESFEEYLGYFGRGGIYVDMDNSGNISGDRWQAFIDYSKSMKTISDKPDDYNIKTNDLGDIKKSAFKLIRQQNLHDAGKIHSLMRDIPKILKKSETKNEFKKLFNDEDIPPTLTGELNRDDDGNELSPEKSDDKWRQTYGHHIVNIATTIRRMLIHRVDTQTPLTLLDEALAKLNHNGMDPRGIDMAYNDTCMDFCAAIRDRASDLLTEFDSNRQKYDELIEGYNS